MTLVAAAAAGVAAIDTVFAEGSDGAVVKAEALAARRAGFAAKLAASPAEAAIVNEAFGAGAHRS